MAQKSSYVVVSPSHVLDNWLSTGWKQGCQMAYLLTKKSQFGYILESLEKKMLVYLWSFRIF
jgi:hypothetical protein